MRDGESRNGKEKPLKKEMGATYGHNFLVSPVVKVAIDKNYSYLFWLHIAKALCVVSFLLFFVLWATNLNYSRVYKDCHRSMFSFFWKCEKVKCIFVYLNIRPIIEKF